MTDRVEFADGKIVETPQEPASPNDLADLMIELRNHETFPNAEISDRGVRQLLNLSYYLSLRPDEGRFSQVQIVTGEVEESSLSVALSKPFSFSNQDEVRRIAPTAESPDSAILVYEDNSGKLLCAGLVDVGTKGHHSLPGRPEIVSVGGKVRFHIWIEGPGHLIVSENQTFNYIAGRIRLVVPGLYIVDQLQQFVVNVGRLVHERVVKSAIDVSDSGAYFGGEGAVVIFVSKMLASILESCIKQRHGGAFLLLSSKDYDSASGIACRYELAEPDLGAIICKYWLTHIEAQESKKKGISDFEGSLRKCNSAKSQLLTTIDRIAQLSAADGCVVFANDLRVIGFGGKIDVAEEEFAVTNQRFSLNGKDECSRQEFLHGIGGQRHQSAARFVIKNDGSIAVVVSQDGDMTVFARNEIGTVRAFGPVDPYFRPSD